MGDEREHVLESETGTETGTEAGNGNAAGTEVAVAEGGFGDFVGIVARCDKEVQRIKAREMARFGLKGPDVMCLHNLLPHPEGVTSSELARMAGVDRAAMSRTVAGLEEAGLIFPRRHDDAYRAPLRLTDRGVIVTREVDEVIDRIVTAAVEGVSREDRATMYRTLGAILTNLCTMSESEER